MVPLSGPRGGGSKLTITGHGFTDSSQAKCRFARVHNGETVTLYSQVAFRDTDEVTCESPQWLLEICTEPGCAMTLSVSNDGVAYSGGVHGFGGTTLDFTILNIPPTVNMASYDNKYGTTSIIDQYIHGGSYTSVGTQNIVYGQEFTPGKSGWLTEVRLQLHNSSFSGAPVTVSVVNKNNQRLA